MHAPTDHTSERPSTCPPRPSACSGAMYEGVPMAVPARVASMLESDSRMRATPKSSTFTSPVLVMKTLAGFTSRWTMPAAWHLLSSSSTGSKMRSVSSSGTLPPLRTRSWPSVSPSSRSITRKGSPVSLTSSSVTGTRAGWSTRLAILPSRRNLSRIWTSRANSAWRSFTAAREPLRCFAA